MGKITVRSIVLVLAVAGFSASSFAAHTVKPNEAKVIIPSTGMTSSPTPLCMPSSGNYCGMH